MRKIRKGKETCLKVLTAFTGLVIVATGLLYTGCEPAGEPSVKITWVDHYVVANDQTVDVGSCEYGSSLDIMFTIENEGGEALEITGMGVDNYAGEGFELTVSFEGSISPGESKDFTIRFSPVAGQEGYGANVTINIVELSEAFSFAVAGAGTDGGTPTIEAPTDLTATAQSYSSILLEWTDNSDNETGFRLERSLDGSSGWTDVDTVGAGVTSHTDDGLNGNTTYWYRVCATGDDGDSSYSDTASATTPSFDTTNPNLTVRNVLDNGILESGFIIGTASDNIAVSSVEVNLDSTGWQTASGTTSWSFQLPTGTDIWKKGTSHTIEVRAKDGADNYSTAFSATVEKGENKDTNGDGYGDLVIGAPGYSDTGRIYLYQGSSSGLATIETLTRQGASGDGFGSSVAISDFDGDGYADVAVGSYGYSTNTGRVQVFYGGETEIEASATTTINGPATSSYFGWTMAAGDANNDGYADLAVGAWGYNSDTGRVTVYHGSDSGLSTTVERTVDGGSSSNLGKALVFGDVDNDGYDDLAIGARSYNPGSAAGTGSVYVFHGSSMGVEIAATRTLTGEAVTNYFGSSLAMGDVNNDGYTDLAVGATGYNSSTGRVYVYHGSASGTSASAGRILTGEATGDYYGIALTLGDYDNNGYADLAIGADSVNSYTGRVYVYNGSSTGIGATGYRTLDGENTSHFFGGSLFSGDANLDGYDDLLVGAIYYDSGYTNRGRMYLYTGSASGLPTTTNRTWLGTDTTNGENFGYWADF